MLTAAQYPTNVLVWGRVSVSIKMESANRLDPNYHELGLILSGSESEEQVASLQSLLSKTEWDREYQLQWLLETLEKKPVFFEYVSGWGGPGRAFKLLKHLFGLERLWNVGDTRSGVERGSPDTQSKYCRVAKGVLKHVPKVLHRRDYDYQGNILHAVCDEGVGSIAEVVMGAMSDTTVTNFLLQSDNKGRRPTKLAVNGKDISLVRLVAAYNDGKRDEHVLEAVQNGNLPFLKVLLEGRKDRDSLLSKGVYNSAAEHGDMEVWKFLTEEKPDSGKDPQHLKRAVEKRRVNIVRHILDHNLEVLQAQDKLAETARIAVNLSRNKSHAADGSDATSLEKEDRERSIEIEDLVLDKMVRELHPSVVKACWPRDEGRAAREVSLELNLRNPRNWTWFAQIVKTAKFEVNDWQKRKEEEAKRLEEEVRQKAEEEARQKAEEEARNSKERKKLERYSGMLEETAKRLLLEDSQRQEGVWDEAAEEKVRKVLEIARNQVEEVRKILDEESKGALQGSEASSQAAVEMNRIETPEVDILNPQSPPPANDASLLEVAPYPSRYNVDFQPYLKSVSIPDLDQFRTHECAIQVSDMFGNEVKYILHWLRFVKGVRRILKLRVLDSRYRPHSEEAIEESIKDLHIEELDWKRFDLSTRTLGVAAEKAHTLHLYSSGSWVPVCHWIGPDGLKTLSEVKNLHITIIKDLESGITQARALEQDEELRNFLQREGWKPEGEQVNEEDKHFSLKISPWIIAGPPTSGNKDVAVVREYVEPNPDSLSTINRASSPRTVIRLSKFVTRYQRVHKKRSNSQYTHKKLNRIRVAILDSGVDQGEFETTSDLMGDSFSEGEESHWWLSSERHGTQMAKIVKAIDPCCQLFIAKVADHRAAITVGAVVKALKRAKNDNMDVISMSFALNNPDNNLRDAIDDAYHDGIVLLCSTADEGDNRTQAWPASYGNTFAIAACNDEGEKSPSSTTEAQYYFRGENVLYEPLKGNNVGSSEKISGSSVATAIAAGVASLCLSCCQLDGSTVDDRDRRRKVRELFDKAKDKKYVRPWVLFGETPRGDNESMFLP